VSDIREITVIFGGETQRVHYIRESGADPKDVISACYPHIIGIMQVGEEVDFRVVRYFEDEWSYISTAFSDNLQETELRLGLYRAQGKHVTEVSL
jgi:hypothetical protein